MVAEVIAREYHDYTRPLSFAARDRKRSATVLYEQLDYGQSDTKSGTASRGGPIKQFQHARCFVV